MAEFDPDAYLASKGISSSKDTGGFDPDAYLASKGISTEKKEPTLAESASKFLTSPQSLLPQGNKTEAGAVVDALKLVTPPFDPREIFGGRAMAAENIGQSAKSSLQGQLSNIATSPSNINPTVKGAGLGALSAATALVPGTPSEVLPIGAGKLLPQAIGSLTEGFTNSVANRFFNKIKDINEGRLNKGELPLGEDVMSDPNLKEIRVNDRKEIYGKVTSEIKKLGNTINKKINELFQQGKTSTPDEFGPQGEPLALEYKPTQTSADIPTREIGGGTGRPIAPPSIASEAVPERNVEFRGQREPVFYDELGTPYTRNQIINSEVPQTVSENVPAKEIPFSGTRQEVVYDKLGVPIRRDIPPETLYPQTEAGGFTRETPVNSPTGTFQDRLQPQTTYGGFNRETPVGSNFPEGDTSQLSTAKKSGLGEATRSLNEPERYPFTGVKKEPNIKISEIVDSAVDPLIEQAKASYGTESKEVRQLNNYKRIFLSGKPEFMDFKAANDLRESLGETLGKKFNKQNNVLSEVDYAIKNVWQSLRNKISQISPEVSNLLDQQHKLFDIQRSVAPEVAKGFSELPKDFWDLATNPFKENVGLADLINSNLQSRGTGVGQGAMTGLERFALDNYLKSKGKKK